MLIDTHCHLDFPEFEPDRNEVIQRAKANGIDYLINIGSSLEGSKNSAQLTLKYDYIYAVVGIHPHEADRVDKSSIDIIEELAGKNKVVAIGETGLDYFRNYSTQKNQRLLFTALIKLSKSLNLPLVLHSRQAEEETLNILKEFPPQKAVVHCFSGSADFLERCLDLGLFISFTCNITYKKAENLRSIVKLTPLERIMLETDCPYLSPEGFRGRRNEPLQVKLLANEIARIKEISFEEVEEKTTQTAKNFFHLP